MKTECDKNILGGEEWAQRRQQKKKKFRLRSLKDEESEEMQKPGKENAGEYEE